VLDTAIYGKDGCTCHPQTSPTLSVGKSSRAWKRGIRNEIVVSGRNATGQVAHCDLCATENDIIMSIPDPTRPPDGNLTPLRN
jgi:hypothetical protein